MASATFIRINEAGWPLGAGAPDLNVLLSETGMVPMRLLSLTHKHPFPEPP